MCVAIAGCEGRGPPAWPKRGKPDPGQSIPLPGPTGPRLYFPFVNNRSVVNNRSGPRHPGPGHGSGPGIRVPDPGALGLRPKPVGKAQGLGPGALGQGSEAWARDPGPGPGVLDQGSWATGPGPGASYPGPRGLEPGCRGLTHGQGPDAGAWNDYLQRNDDLQTKNNGSGPTGLG